MLRSTWLRMLAMLAVLAMAAAACGDNGAADPVDDDDDTDEVIDDDPVDDEPADDDGVDDEPADDEDDAAVEDDGDIDDDPDVTEAPTDRLVLGNVLPETGDLAFLGPPMIRATELAVQEINEAGGVLGNDVELLLGDSGDGDGTVANQTVDRHLAAGVSAILGAAASGISLTIIDKITGNGIIQFSPSNTATTFTDYPDDGFYFRTAPSDALQGPVLADTIVSDGGTAVAILARSDDYGRGLAEAVRDNLEDAGAEVTNFIVYDQQAQNFDAEVSDVAAASPDAVVVVGFDESARILSSMIEQGVGPGDVLVYGVDGNASSDLAGQTNPDDPSVLEGMRGTRPAAESNPEFVQRLQEFDPDLDELSFAAESYDAVAIIALAAETAGSAAPDAIAAEINNVTRPGGTECTDIAECLELARNGEDITYSGALGILNFLDQGEPGAGTYEIWELDASGELQVISTQEISL